MFGYGGLRSLEGGEDLADATLSLGEITQQLQPGGVRECIKDLNAQIRDRFLGHDERYPVRIYI
jgi:hypothetical protein